MKTFIFTLYSLLRHKHLSFKNASWDQKPYKTGLCTQETIVLVLLINYR
ncbi:hypothetical protein METHB2_1010006 [Candidatus Methylobacter favarea]|uniref:Uncharacterized protein n=1 Tax=Candidatus Methylobacter favarea TaxID=2707345 RepID=A0A8S0XH66_9GAMM|nr:hypothetical protein METHB2_1010006 [Candidatus Methylobacter favarea]